MDLSVFMTSADPGFHLIGKQIFGQLDDSSFYASLRVCKSWYGCLEPEWQVRRRKAMFEQVKTDCFSLLNGYYGYEKEKKDFIEKLIEKLLDPNITFELCETTYNDFGWRLFASAFHANNVKVLSFLLNHPNIKTIIFGHSRNDGYGGYGESWSTQILKEMWKCSEDTLKMILAHPKFQPFGYDMELGKTRIPFAFNSLPISSLPDEAEGKLRLVRVSKMILQYPNFGPVDFSKGNLSSRDGIGNALHRAIDCYNVPMVELILNHCPQDILTSDTGNGSSRYSPLHTAIYRNHPNIVKILLDHKKFEPHFLVSLKMKHMRSPIQQAVEWKRLEIVKVILDHPKCDRSMLLSLDGSLIFGGKEVRKIVIEHPKMKSIRDFVKSVERYLK
eukprot:04684.XXX_250427_251590_1 [CDS] Oithona nana genome sequencing.